MQDRRIKLPELALVAGTRGVLGVGLGLLISERLRPRRRRTVGWTLFLIGVASTIPLAARLFWRSGNSESARGQATAVMGG